MTRVVTASVKEGDLFGPRVRRCSPFSRAPPRRWERGRLDKPVTVNKAPVKRVSIKWVTPFFDMCRYLHKAGVSHIEWLTLDPERHIQKDPQRLILVVLDRYFVAGLDYTKGSAGSRRKGLTTCLRQELLGAGESRVL